MARVNSLHRVASSRAKVPRRVAVISVHTSPLDQPGTGDAGGMNVYIVEVSRRLAEAGVEVEIFTRAAHRDLPPVVEMNPGVTVRHIVSGPFEGIAKEDLPAQLCAFANELLRDEVATRPGRYGLVHSHYWMSGQVGWVAKDQWGIPLVHTAHTLAKVKNRMRPDGDVHEPTTRIRGEERVVEEAERLIVNTPTEGRELVALYGAEPERVSVVPPGVDLTVFSPVAASERLAARERLGFAPHATVVAFVGRIQPLKAPDVLLRAAARLRADDPELGRRLVVAVCGGSSGSGLDRSASLMELANDLGLAGVARFLPPRSGQELADVYRAADLVAVPSHSESFGLVALEAQACGTPVVAADVGGLGTAVRDGVSGILVDGHSPGDWAKVIGHLLSEPGYRDQLSRGALVHAQNFSWNKTACGVLAAYRDTVTRRNGLLATCQPGARCS